MIRHFPLNFLINVFVVTEESLRVSTAPYGFRHGVIKVLWSAHCVHAMLCTHELPFKERPGILCRNKMKN